MLTKVVAFLHSFLHSICGSFTRSFIYQSICCHEKPVRRHLFAHSSSLYFVNPFIFPPVRSSIYPAIYPSVCSSIHPSNSPFFKVHSELEAILSKFTAFEFKAMKLCLQRRRKRRTPTCVVHQTIRTGVLSWNKWATLSFSSNFHPLPREVKNGAFV